MVNGDLEADSVGANKLRVGSIKTVIGHLEGTAGLAGLLKASLAVQHGLIPPNMHFDQLNPKVQPFYEHVEVPTKLLPWPETAPGTPRRASINSFGFGGTNAHAIIERWDGQSQTVLQNGHGQGDTDLARFGPFTASANSETALLASVESLSATLQADDPIDPARLSWTLQLHRTPLPFRASFSATTQEQLIGKLDSFIQIQKHSRASTKAVKVPGDVSLLGVFTGQGAQWPRMGAVLYERHPSFRDTIQRLEETLKKTPDGPTWSLTEELLAPAASSRVSSAEISQPLCTAVQVALVDLLNECGVTFAAVVGHSSGEIAAAYAAGILDARAAILISYYRGYHSKLSRSPSGEAGAMMAVGMSMEEAEAFCRQPEFLGRIRLAASNSASSVTLSGDASAVHEAKRVLDERKTFARVLRVDTAYHSHHMEAARQPYIDSLRHCKIQAPRPSSKGACTWFSSVYDSQDQTTQYSYEGSYWVENMVRPVLFSQAVTTAIQGKHFDLAIEVGPHPALQGPAIETMKHVNGSGILYHGSLKRNEDDVLSFVDMLGFLWASLDCPRPPVDFRRFRQSLQACPASFKTPRVLKGLPSYHWDHRKSFLSEPKKVRDWRTRNGPIQELLGTPSYSCNNEEVRWRNILKLNEISWLSGHRFQNQVLFPAAAYLSMAINAMLHHARDGQAVQMVELQNCKIHNAVTLGEGIGVNIELVVRTLHEGPERMVADICCCCSNADTTSPELDKKVFTAQAVMVFGEPDEDALPSRVSPDIPLSDVSLDRFYRWMRNLGHDYSGDFLMSSIKRRLDVSTVTAKRVHTEKYKMHPSTLDTVLQSIFAAFSYPGDGRLWTAYLPTDFQRIRINMASCSHSKTRQSSELVADCRVAKASASEVSGDIDVYCAEDGFPEIQIQGFVLSSLEAPAQTNDRSFFARTVWAKEMSPGNSIGSEDAHTDLAALENHRKLYQTCERTAYFYLRMLCDEIPETEIPSLDWHFQCLMRWARDHVLPAPEAGTYPGISASWRNDTSESVAELMSGIYDGQIDLRLLHKLGPKFPSILRGSVSALQLLMEDDLLGKLYENGFGFPEANARIGAVMGQVSHRYPKLRVLEIGSGTGGATSMSLKHLGRNLQEYLFTDISPGFFEEAQEKFADFSSMMTYAVLDIEKSPTEQGFEPQSFDLIIASNVLHATKFLSRTLNNCRELLCPGGYLVLLELTGPGLRIPFLFSGLPGWWLGHEDGRTHGPTISEARWDSVLRESNFSGVDHVLRDFQEDSIYSYSVMISQALDDRINLLREPLEHVWPVNASLARIQELVIIGGGSLSTSKLTRKVKEVLGPYAETVVILNHLEEVSKRRLQLGCAAICLTDLDQPVFKGMTQQRLEAIQLLCKTSKYFLWATRGCRASEPTANMMVGLGRTIAREMSHLRLKFVDFDRVENHQAAGTKISELFLEMVLLDGPGFDQVFWSQETELRIQSGQSYIPRVVPDEDLNARFNATRREISRNVLPNSKPVRVKNTSAGAILEDMTAENAGCTGDTVEVHVRSSSLLHFSSPDHDGSFYLSAGNIEKTGQSVLAISEQNAPRVHVQQDHIIELPLDSPNDSARMLQGALSVAICEGMLSGIDRSIWIHNANNAVFDLVNQLATAKGIKTFFSTNDKSSDLALAGKSAYIHPNIAQNNLKRLAPNDVERFVHWKAASGAGGFDDLVASCLGRGVDIRKSSANSDVTQQMVLPYTPCDLVEILRSFALDPNPLRSLKDLGHGLVINAGAVHEGIPAASSPTDVLDWADVESVTVRVQPTNERIRFAPQKTHFFIGLTGDVGLSLCEWMADHGATHFALASRNPKVDPRIIRHLEQKGVTVRILQLDIADRESLKQVHGEIVATMPPISGVASGALVLRDKPFESMMLEDLDVVFGPRVRGSQNLDDLFFSTPLDFFILFSSLAGIVGNPGQSNYNASNMFMSALAAQRRKRGLAASVLDIGMLVGFGNIHNDGPEGPKLGVEAQFRREGFMSISEPDFHVMFAEAIESGRPQSGLDHEIVTGLGDYVDTDWRRSPRFSNYNTEEVKRDHNQGHMNTQRSRNIHDLLAEAEDAEQALATIQDSFATKLGVLLGSSSADFDRDVALTTLGLDSLVAVEIRSWLIKTLEVDVPVLKILGGASLSGICQDVIGKLPMLLKPWAANTEESVDMDGALGPSTSNWPVRALTAASELEPSLSQHPEQPLSNREVIDLDRAIALPLDRTAEVVSRIQPSEVIYERVSEVSPAQAQLYFLYEYLENQSAYNVAYHGIFRGNLDTLRLQQALSTVAERHESLRSAYFRDPSTKKPMQGVLPKPGIIFEQRNSGTGEVEKAISEVKDFIFDIEHGVVMKVTVLSESPSLHFILFNHHHIALDGVSWAIFVTDLARAYSERNLLPFIQQGIEMTTKRLASMTPEILSEDLAFWEQTYKKPPEPLPLFAFANVKTRQALKKHVNHSVGTELGPETTALVRKAARKLGMTSFHFYLAAVAAFLSRCLAVTDMAVGVVDANRFDAEDADTIGYFLNILPVRITLRPDEAFGTVARRTRDAALGAMAHSRAPYDTVLGHLGAARQGNANPLFQVAVNYHKGLSDVTALGSDGKIAWTGGVPAGNPYDLLVSVHEFRDRTMLSFVTQAYMYDTSDAEMMLGWFSRAVEGLAAETSTKISRCPIADDSDTRAAIDLGRGSDTEVPWKGTLIDRIDEVAQQFPTDTAIQDDEGQVLTYAQMQARTLQISRRLRNMSIAPGSFVAMLLDPSADAVCTILAVMRMGLVWVPLDIKNHHDRLHAILSEARPPVLVCHGATKERAQRHAGEIAHEMLLLDLDTSSSAPEDERPVPNLGKADRPAAVLHTSGSTGVPKGAILSHGGLVNQIYGTAAQLGLGREVTLQQSPLGFDLMLDQVFLALCNGGKIIVVGSDGRGDPLHIANLIVSRGVTLTHFVPSEYLALLNYGFHILKGCGDWRFAMSGGERLVPELRRAFRKLESGQLRLVNVYGPAEITIACARGFVAYRTDEDVLSSVDQLRPSPNYCIEIVDADMNTVPVGYPGEICVSGPGVGMGYLNRPEETRRRFLTRSPACPRGSKGEVHRQWPRVYRTGDLGRLLSDGTLKVLGRLDGDTQVKIRGHRVELDEISNALVQACRGSVTNAAVSLRASDVLAAFIVFDTEFTGDKSAFAKDLSANLPLPMYMRPEFIVPVDRIPSNENGKTDRTAVDQLTIPDLNGQEVDATTGNTESLSPMEQSLKDTWQEVLASRAAGTKARAITSCSDFFEVGGNSLLLISLRSVLQSTYGLTLTLPELFQSSTLSSMAACIEKNVKQHEVLPESRTNGSSEINWDVELATLADGLPEVQVHGVLDSTPPDSPSRADGLTVLLTGSTGFIGTHLLRSLVQDPRIQKVHCVAVRPSSTGEPRRLSISSPKIIHHQGDLSSPGLGLSHAERASLSGDIDVIIHNGADVSLLKSYQTLRRPNVVSTRTLCGIAAAAGGIPLHFVSTAAVARVAIDYDVDPTAALPEVSVSTNRPTDEINGYITSKWASEALLDKAAADQRVRAWVHRLAHVVGDDPSELDAVGMLVKYSLLMGRLPAWTNKAKVVGEWDFVAVEDVVRDLVEAAVGSAGSSNGGRTGSELKQAGAHYMNHCADVKVPHAELRGYLEGQAGAPLAVVETEEWLAAAVEEGMNPLICDFLRGFFSGGNKVVLPLLVKGKSS